MENWTLLGRLWRAVNKIKFILGFDIRRWLPFVSSRRRLPSFSDRPGLRACVDENWNDSFSESEGSTTPSRGRLLRTTSYPSSSSQEDDVDKMAELFIANFYERLQLERQVSLDLRYCRGNSLESRSPL
ncbi:hypothetical protein MLD38_014900 [Melastoma candidum]|uniref:Uncharacterized protein n=1 Tax=Melastoma candidum TaxID=119954 RepID=A0ACB9RE62_9MYRT|nr:hypothetical protein MLD38_014900 [Melastoma candidum]